MKKITIQEKGDYINPYMLKHYGIFQTVIGSSASLLWTDTAFTIVWKVFLCFQQAPPWPQQEAFGAPVSTQTQGNKKMHKHILGLSQKA